MVTPRIPVRQQREGLPIGLRRFLISGRRCAWYYLLHLNNDDGCAFWHEHSDCVVDRYAKRHPGQRPILWWRFSAPRPRARFGGIGDPLSACGGAYRERYEYGVPADWLTPDEKFPRGTPIDPSNPPLFESEAAYLKRLRLLLPGEAQLIPPSGYWSVAVRVSDELVQLVPVNAH